MRTFAACILAATVFADGHGDHEKDHDMMGHDDHDMMHGDDMGWEMSDEQMKQWGVVKDLVDVFCGDSDSDSDSDSDHDGHHDKDDDHMWEDDDMMWGDDSMPMEEEKWDGSMEEEKWDGSVEEVAVARSADWDMNMDMEHGWDDEKDGHHDKHMDEGKHHEGVKDDWMCRHAKKMMHEMEEFHYSDHDGKKKKAHGWMQEMESNWGWDGATSTVTYGAAVIAAVSALFF